MTCASLFSGIGGFDLTADWMGWKTLLQCEFNAFNQRILKYYWPDAELFGDIKQTDFTKYEGLIDILTGGFPCQPYSVAGKRKGTADDRHLWPEMLRAIREIKPRWVVGENVRGIVSWDEGLVFEQVQLDLEAEGYQVLPFLLPACAVGAPHKRERIWFVAYNSSHTKCKRLPKLEEGQQQSVLNVKRSGLQKSFTDTHENYSSSRCSQQKQLRQTIVTKSGDGGVSTDTYSARLQTPGTEQQTTGSEQHGEFCRLFSTNANASASSRRGDENNRWREPRQPYQEGTPANWQDFPTQSPACSGDDGLPAKLDGITFSGWRNKSIQGYGNAIVPQVVYQIYEAIEMYDALY